MFERSKKDGTDKAQEDWSRDESPRAYSAPSADPVRPRADGKSADVAVIGRSIRIDGDLAGDEDLRIEGDVNGTVQLRNNTLTIGREGKIRANVYAKSVTVDGLMEGDLYGSERVCIRSNAQVRGNITAPRVSLEDGARFKGSIEMDPKAVETALGASAGKAAQPATATKGNSTGARPNGNRPVGKPGDAALKSASKNDAIT